MGFNFGPILDETIQQDETVPQLEHAIRVLKPFDVYPLPKGHIPKSILHLDSDRSR